MAGKIGLESLTKSNIRHRQMLAITTKLMIFIWVMIDNRYWIASEVNLSKGNYKQYHTMDVFLLMEGMEINQVPEQNNFEYQYIIYKSNRYRVIRLK